MPIPAPEPGQKRVVIIGGGFGGIKLTGALLRKNFQVVLFDKNNYHTFQPLFYQVATGGLEPDSIAFPLRKIFQHRTHFYFRMGEVDCIDYQQNKIFSSIGSLEYDYLVIATGSTNNFFGLESKKEQMLTLKSLLESLDIRSLLLQNFERALLCTRESEKEALMNVVIVGAGPSGVELAGAIAEMRKWVLPEDYPELNFEEMEIYLFEMSDRVLATMSSEASEKAARYLQKMGVNIRLKEAITDYDGKLACSSNGAKIATENFIWTAGVKGAIVKGLPQELIARGNRIEVDEYNRVKGFENIFAIGDVALQVHEGYPHGLPMVAPVAMQQGVHLARTLNMLARGKSPRPFKYVNKGAMATIGRNKAVADIFKSTFGGFFAWFIWMFIHIMQLIGFRNRAVVFINWAWSYFTYDHANRLILRVYKRPGRQQRKKKRDSEICK